MEKVRRDQVATYLDTAPSTTSTWELLGIGITSYGIAFNPQITTEKWIIHENATSSHEGNQKQGDVSQKIYKRSAYLFSPLLRERPMAFATPPVYAEKSPDRLPGEAPFRSGVEP